MVPTFDKKTRRLLENKLDKPFLLVPESIPKPLWGKSLSHREAKLCSYSLWKRIKRNVISYYKRRCSYCGFELGDTGRPRRGELFCHEVWEYDDINRVQKLVDFRTACVNCNDVLHLGRLNILLQQGLVTEDRHTEIIKHLYQVNGIVLRIQEDIYQAELRGLVTLFNIRSSYTDWSQDFSKLDILSSKFGVLEEIRTEEKFREVERLLKEGYSIVEALKRV